MSRLKTNLTDSFEKALNWQDENSLKGIAVVQTVKRGIS
jgi:hypothetical protein